MCGITYILHRSVEKSRAIITSMESSYSVKAPNVQGNDCPLVDGEGEEEKYKICSHIYEA